MTTAMSARRRALAAVGAALVVGGLGGLAVAVLTPTVYTATATVFVRLPGAAQVLPAQPLPAERQVVSAYVDMATTPVVLQPVIAELGLRTTPAALAGRIHVDVPESRMLRIGVTDSSAVSASAIADSVQRHLVDVSRSLTPSTGSARQRQLRVLERPEVPTSPSAPVRAVDVVAGAVAGGLLLGLVEVVVITVRVARRPRSGQLAAPSMF